jgi:hypothetical protein
VRAWVIQDMRYSGVQREALLDDGRWVVLEDGMVARYLPHSGDYYVVQADNYVYVNPKDVFERKYRPVPPSPIALAGDITTMEQAKAAGLTDAPDPKAAPDSASSSSPVQESSGTDASPSTPSPETTDPGKAA